MPLHKIRDFDPRYRDHFEDRDVIGYDLYASSDKIGSVDDLLVDDAGKIRYLVVNTGILILGKKVLLPIGRARIDYSGRRIAVDGLTRVQVEALPQYDGNMPIDYEHEEQVRGIYRPTGVGAAPLDYDRNTYAYERDPELYNLDDRNHQNLRLYEERLIASKTRRKTGEVAVGKHVETETARVSVPIEKERVVIERVTPKDAEMPVSPGTVDFREGEVARMEIYEETPDIHKEAFVREEVRVNKVVEQETVQVQDTIRREEIDIDAEGQTIEDRTGRLPKDRI